MDHNEEGRHLGKDGTLQIIVEQLGGELEKTDTPKSQGDGVESTASPECREGRSVLRSEFPSLPELSRVHIPA